MAIVLPGFMFQFRHDVYPLLVILNKYETDVRQFMVFSGMLGVDTV